MVYVVNNDCLAHHGIKGQKWGVRRYQNPDGTLTSEGRAKLYSKQLTGLGFDDATLRYNYNRQKFKLGIQEGKLTRAQRKNDAEKIEKYSKKVDETNKTMDDIYRKRLDINHEIYDLIGKVLKDNMSVSEKEVFRRPTTRFTLGRKTANNILANSGGDFLYATPLNTFERTTKYKAIPNKPGQKSMRFNSTRFYNSIVPADEIVYINRQY